MTTSTNYYDTFIEVAEDTKATSGTEPPLRGSKKSVANYEFEMVHKHPYKYTSDDVFFYVYAQRNDLSKSKLEKERELFFSKGRPCFRASPLTKTYGWGVHSNEQGKVAIYGMETEEYAHFVKDKKTDKKKAMRSSRK
jgi:hypothetical protein